MPGKDRLLCRMDCEISRAIENERRTAPRRRPRPALRNDSTAPAFPARAALFLHTRIDTQTLRCLQLSSTGKRGTSRKGTEASGMSTQTAFPESTSSLHLALAKHPSCASKTSSTTLSWMQLPQARRSMAALVRSAERQRSRLVHSGSPGLPGQLPDLLSLPDIGKPLSKSSTCHAKRQEIAPHGGQHGMPNKCQANRSQP